MTKRSRAGRSLAATFLVFMFASGAGASVLAVGGANAQNVPGQAQAAYPLTGSGNQTIQNYNYYYWPIDVTTTSYAVYATQSNVSVAAAFMSAAQFAAFSGGTAPISDSLTQRNGTSTLDGLLVPSGSYYFTVCACMGSAQVAYYYAANLTLTVTNDTMNVGEFITLPSMQGTTAYYQIPLHLETLGSTSKLSLFGISNQTVTYSVYDFSTGTTLFTSPAVTTTNANGTAPSAQNFSPYYNLTLPVGQYALRIVNDHAASAYVYVGYSLNPAHTDPYLFFAAPAAAQPTGIASFGLYNDSGVVRPYTIDAPGVVGYANITSLDATDLNATQFNLPPSSSGVQLNSIVQVNNTDGSQYSYWSQNVVQFIGQSGGTYYGFVDNVWNMTGDGAGLSNSTIRSNDGGTVQSYTSNGATSTLYYAFYPGGNNLFAYRFPLSFAVAMNVTVVKGQGLYIGFAEELLQNGSLVQGPQKFWYDKAFIADPNILSAAFHTSGSDYTPAGANSRQGLFYDTEFVFGGDSSGSMSSFNKLNGQLGLYYLDPATLAATLFPSYYSFGQDTAENTPNVHVAFLGTATVQVSAGSADYSYLGAPSTATTSVTFPGGRTSTLGQSTSGSSPPVGAGLAYVAIPVVIVVALAALFIGMRMRRKGLPPPPPPGF
ncbi:MAG: thermopsin family protease [Thaumarchaeota archaeon]|nr:thermopsin family protease [Nitrososphaerota archaeon]